MRISVQIVDVRGSRVRVGVDAPIEIRVLREELDVAPSDQPRSEHVFRLPKELRHELRNTLNEIVLMLHVYQRKQERALQCESAAGSQLDANVAFETIVERLQALASHAALASGHSANCETNRIEADTPNTLLVEDNDNERELLAGFLRMNGQRVTTASDGAEALAYLDGQATPDVILVDMQMPRCDGGTLIRRLRSQKRFDDTQIFVTSGQTPREAGLDQRADRFDGWFQKPLDPRRLAEALSNAAGLE